MDRLIETQNATLDTLSVTIRAIHVGGKQMTLSVFRQIPEARIYSSDGGREGDFQLWGLVRYEIKDEGYLWVVASKDGVLYRCNATSRFKSVLDVTSIHDRAAAAIPRIETYLQALIAHRQAHDEWRAKERELMEECPYGLFQCANQTLAEWAATSGKRREWLASRLSPPPGNPPPDPPRLGAGFRSYEDELKVLQRELEWAKYYITIARKAEATYKTLMSLPQLFIAV